MASSKWLIAYLLIPFSLCFPFTPTHELLPRYTGDVTGILDGANGPSPFPDDANITASFIDPGHVPYVFWASVHSRGDKVAHDFARTVGGVTVEDTFPPDFICINSRGHPWWYNFADRVSGIYADHAAELSTSIYLVTSAYDKITDRKTTFIRVESPSLQAGGVRSVTVVDAADFTRTKSVPIVSGHDELFARGTHVPITLDWLGYGDDPDGYCAVKDLTPAYSAGWCGVHIAQRRSDNKGIGNIKPVWDFTIQLKDDNGEPIGDSQVAITAGSSYDQTGALPYVFIVTPGTVGYGDDSPILLQYAGWSTLTQSPACSVGGYDNGWRQMDCGFPCP
ncbi:hypothetical protein AMS68_006847 [Peltaster fructicola]|uniref:Uncharacterized protein n=1 Tax=Peltaster fructicola TaxID=286661 RepID=A0A6H0Y3Y4_9PEZI|nr:hypothetical protein AMS68_006847 [Peltaster fructicola]